ncbi:major facilitator transporter [Rhodococcus opacus]|uniref:Major facilitator transporter n=1 Tax=Rhodococcus opacus TaxID=37919 RepID=A0A1B1K7X3_RHOOP|nr:major facilitator transporter [Rhodococcus opacus]
MSRDRRRSTTSPRPIRLGLGPNLAQFSLLVAVNALVGGMVGQQQTVLPLLASGEFRLTGYTFIFTYVAAFGITKAAANYFAGTWSDRFGRKPVLLVGWLFAIPVPLMLIAAPNWWWVVAANVLLGINQGLTWSTTVVMKIDLVGPARRGLAMGLNEAAGYGAVAVSSLMAGYLADQYGLRPAPFLLGLAYTALALLLSGVEPPWIEWRPRSGHLKDRGDGGALFTVARLVVDRREVVDRRMQSVRVEPADPFGGLPLDLGSA